MISEQLNFSSGGPAGHLVLFAANCRPLLNYIIVPINYTRMAVISWLPIAYKKREPVQKDTEDYNVCGVTRNIASHVSDQLKVKKAT